jgi:hypothetical protein
MLLPLLLNNLLEDGIPVILIDTDSPVETRIEAEGFQSTASADSPVARVVTTDQEVG